MIIALPIQTIMDGVQELSIVLTVVGALTVTLLSQCTRLKKAISANTITKEHSSSRPTTSQAASASATSSATPSPNAAPAPRVNQAAASGTPSKEQPKDVKEPPKENKPAVPPQSREPSKSSPGDAPKPVSVQKMLENDQTQTSGEEPVDEKKEEVIDPVNVEKLGNLDFISKEKRVDLLKEIEKMKSVHELESSAAVEGSADKHVVIVEKQCKLYETNDDPTLDDELDDAI